MRHQLNLWLERRRLDDRLRACQRRALKPPIGTRTHEYRSRPSAPALARRDAVRHVKYVKSLEHRVAKSVQSLTYDLLGCVERRVVQQSTEGR